MGIEFKILDLLQNIRTPVGGYGDVFYYQIRRCGNGLDSISGYTAGDSKDTEIWTCIDDGIMRRSCVMQWNIKKFVCQNTPMRYKYSGSVANCKTG